MWFIGYCGIVGFEYDMVFMTPTGIHNSKVVSRILENLWTCVSSFKFEVCLVLTSFTLVHRCQHFGGIAASIFKVTLKLGAAVSLKITDTCLPNYMVSSLGTAVVT
jgi:hypothetical protein